MPQAKCEVRTQRHSCGYLLQHCPEHPYANHQGFVPQHRLIMEAQIGRIVNPCIEHVHHIDGIKDNNSPNNLVLLDIQTHRRLHRGWVFRSGEWWKVCPECNRLLPVESSFYKRSSGTFVNLWKPCSVQISNSIAHAEVMTRTTECKRQGIRRLGHPIYPQPEVRLRRNSEGDQMRVKDVQEAIGEAQRFITKANHCLDREYEEYKSHARLSVFCKSCTESAACKRASMDLTRALSKMRK